MRSSCGSCFLDDACRHLPHIARLRDLSPKSMQLLAKVVLPRLRTVDLTDTRRITAAGIAAFVANCPRIQRLVMTRCRFGGTDDSLMAIAGG